MVVPYGYELPKDRAKFYSAVRCLFCLCHDDLHIYEGTRFLCSWCAKSKWFSDKSIDYVRAS